LVAWRHSSLASDRVHRTHRTSGVGREDYAVSALDDLIAACDALATDTHYAIKARALAARLKAWAVTVPTPAATPVPVGAVLFADEFNGTALDTAKWDVKNLSGGVTAFVPSAVSVHDGALDIVATTDAAGKWSSGEIQGQPVTAYTGPRYLEARAKVPVGLGTWPAPLWERDAPWGALGIENDVSEQLGREPTAYHVTVHNGPTSSFGKVVQAGVNLADAFHRYGCAMYADHADYYLDGLRVATITAAEAGLSAWKFTTTPMVPLIDLDMGGSWAGTISVAPPVHFLVDYVRVWALA
jgi:beta-glucanase (GH16 family)